MRSHLTSGFDRTKVILYRAGARKNRGVSFVKDMESGTPRAEVSVEGAAAGGNAAGQAGETAGVPAVEPADVEAALRAAMDALCERVRTYAPSVDESVLRGAYLFAKLAHDGQLRKSGEPYIIHPVQVALIVADLSLDVDSVIAALLHDTIEDTGYGYKDIRGRFGAKVADLVEGVTKLTRTAFTSKEEEQMENLRKMFLAMSKDIRVLLIKISDRLHNMRTLEYREEKGRRETSRETMEIYAPLAHRLGMQRFKWELEDRALQNLDPVGYAEISQELKTREETQAEFLEQIQKRISDRLQEVGISCTMEGRVKHIYSIYRKMMGQHKAMFEIYDLYAVRVIVDDLADCYNVLGFVHDLYKPIPGRVKDYISTPKPNMYQSLHTTVIGREGQPFEVQIRSWEMHHTAEYGIAAHWKYKSGDTGGLRLEEKLEWVRRLLESQQDTDAEDFISTIKVDMLTEDVYVFTPKGDVKSLPQGANPIDFAYAIHSAVGNRMTGARVNGRIVAIDYTLQSGDIVEILIGGGHGGPSRDWLKIVKTSEARSKIKQWFKKEKREENIVQGKLDFERERMRSGIPAASVLQEDTLGAVLKKLSFTSMDDIYAAIGYGGLSAQRVLNRFRDELIHFNRLQTDKATVEKLVSQVRRPRRGISGVIVEGLDNCLVKFSRCCSPVPGDDIIGFITRGFGVSVHRKDCTNVRVNTEKDDGRWVEVSWADEITDMYQTGLQVSARDREGLLVDVATALSALKVPIHSLSARSLGDGYAVLGLSVDIRDLEQLEYVFHKLSRVGGVIEVKRKDTA